MDDKVIVIICATLIVLCAMFQMKDAAATIVNSGLTGLFGVAVGKAIGNQKP